VKFGKQSNRKVKSSITDTVRSAGVTLATDVYLGTVKKAYIQETQAGANMFKVEIKFEGGKVLRASECIFSGDAKGNSNTYVDKKTGEEKYLPGWDFLTEFLSATLGEDLIDDNDELKTILDLHEDGDVENKAVMIYDFNKKKEIPTKVPVIVPVIGKEIRVGVQDVFIDIPLKKDGQYVRKNNKNVPSGKYTRTNVMDKFFNAETGQTHTEFVEDKDPEFYKKWLAMKGHVYDRTENNIAPVKDGKVVAAADNGESSDKDGKRSTKSLFNK
jgi:hypothetical protein